MEIRLFNTLSGKKEFLPVPKKGKKLRLFVCGPTVYDEPHLGHARTYIFFDFLAKYLRSRGVPLFYLQNITNVEDRIIARARKEKKDYLRVADFFAKEYFRAMKSLGVTSVDKYAPTTDYIPQVVKQVQTLIKKGFAYKIENDGYYFDILKFPGYGKLSRRTALQAEDSVSRIDESVKKRNRGDFCLWKFPQTADERRLHTDSRESKKNFAVVDYEPLWNTPLGWGRPGWHIEDTATTEHFFGPQYDIHGGGVDLKFPHHEAEIAQQEAASGKKPFVKLWVHTGMLTVNGDKMSKSLGNFITIKDFLKKHSPETLRFMILSHHYRMPMDYTEELANQAEKNLDTISMFLAKIDFRLNILKKGTIDIVHWKKGHGFASPATFESNLSNDLNTPAAISLLFDRINYGNKYLRMMNQNDLVETKSFINKSLNLLGLRVKKPKIPHRIALLAAERETFRRNKQFMQSDALRKKILGLGYVIEDTPAGPFVWPAPKN